MKKELLRFYAFLCCLTVLTGLLIRTSPPKSICSQSTEANKPLPTVVLDAGHGGEDGGAVSASGLFEKDVNLSIVFYLRDLLEANGISVRLTRLDDRLLYDRSVDYQGKKKALDLEARRRIAEETEHSVLVSIHMNAFPISKYSGLQVWYSMNHPASLMLAETVQNAARTMLQPNNQRKVKSATSAIYLLHHATSPAILIECGFLSNPEEAELLGLEEYQRELAFVIFSALNGALRKI